MLIALVLICSIKVTPDLQDWIRDNATGGLRAPGEFRHPATCSMQVQVFAPAPLQDLRRYCRTLISGSTITGNAAKASI